VAVEWSENTLSTFTIPRLTKVVTGDDLGGVTGATGWAGGGGFRILDVASSMFAEDQGTVVLAAWATGGALGEATAAQLGYEFEPDGAPFCGRKGRSRLAVIDGMVNRDVVRIIANALAEDETMVICGTSVDPESRTALSELSRGSTIRKIPASIIRGYGRVYRRQRERELHLVEETVTA